MLESQGEEGGLYQSPGGFEFGIQGWSYAAPIPKAITFFLDGSAIVIDQYGRRIRGAVTPEGRSVLFADSPPDANREGDVFARPQFASHAEVIAALAAERYDWLAHEVRWRNKDGKPAARTGLTLAQAQAAQAKLAAEGVQGAHVVRSITCAGWPQLPYEELKKLPELPPTPADELRKILDPALRRAALRARAEADGARARERAGGDEQ